jgi:D-proline reductase (dithiol) PrdB
MDKPLPYLKRISEYYQTLGYGAPYRWARNDSVAFKRLEKPLAEACVAIVTTAALFDPAKGDQGPGAPYNSVAKFFDVYSASTAQEPDLRISHIAIDRAHTTAEDQASYFPLRALRTLERAGEIGPISARFHGLPTNRSHRITREIDSPELVSRCKADGVDIAILVPNCPVCHQSVALTANALETSGITTVISGCARDIVEHVGAPRFLFNDLPLGNSAGRPNDPHGQLQIMRLALDLAVSADRARSTLMSPCQWNGDPDWKKDYSNADLLSDAEIKWRRREFDKAKKKAPARTSGSS